MNPVLLLTHNNLELTQRAVRSVYEQTIETAAWIIDNGSEDGSAEWAAEEGILLDASPFNLGVSVGWNHGLDLLFRERKSDHVLVVGNDTILAPWTFSALLSANVPFASGVDVNMDPLPEKPDVFPLSPHPDFSCFCIRRECWEKVGLFDERFVHYCGDTDYHVRAHRLGIPLWKASVPYNHERSSTIRSASPEERNQLCWQADQDRKTFRSIYGCIPGEPAYEQLFK